MRPIKVGDVYDLGRDRRHITAIDDDYVWSEGKTRGDKLKNTRSIIESFIRDGSLKLSKESRFKSLMEEYAKTKRDSL